MKCKRCGNEIVGEIQRYCNECKSELNGETREKKVHRKPLKKEIKEEIKEDKEAVIERIESYKEKEENIPEETHKRSVFGTILYVLLTIIIMAAVFIGSVIVGFSIGPTLPI